MDVGPLLITVIALAVALAIFAGGWAARLLMRAAEPHKRWNEGGGDEL